MSAFKSDSFKDLTSIQERMNKLFNDSLNRLKKIGETDADKPWAPAVDIFETPDSFILLAEVPGIGKEMLAVELDAGTLVIKGDRPKAAEAEGGKLYHSERNYGEFERRFNLPVNVTPDRIKARVADGVLTVTVAKIEDEATRIKVSVE